LTRRHLQEVRLALDEQGFTETALKAAWLATTNREIAASILGFIRRGALGDPLRPYEDRVRSAVARILESRAWSRPQRDWLERLGQQLIHNQVLDRESFDRGAFREVGGFRRANKIFDDRLLEVVGDLQEEIWRDTA
jgi:type I restriction enzyme R subunit